jgi:hypothetical protein
MYRAFFTQAVALPKRKPPVLLSVRICEICGLTLSSWFSSPPEKKRTAKLAYLAVQDRAGRSNRQPKEILVAPFARRVTLSASADVVLH